MVRVNLDAFARQQQSAGYPVHSHQGVWWQRTAPFFCKPVFPFQVLEPGAARPSPLRAPLGYNHLCADPSRAVKTWPILAMDRETLAGFDPANLIYAKRKNIKRALANLAFERLTAIEPLLPQMQAACIAQAERTGHGKPPGYYALHEAEWRRFLLNEFALPDREWWGAFHEGRLAAYLYAYQVEGTVVFLGFKSNTAFFNHRPNDGLIHHFVSYCRDLGTVERIVFGDWAPDDANLNAFKESFLFQRTDLSVYAVYNPLVRLAKRLR